jgi:flagellar protein FlaJ
MGYRVYFLGEDAVTAINYLANNTPSTVFRETCIELGNIIHSGTGMMEFLEERSQEMIEMRKISLKQFMDDLSMFSEMYLLVSMTNILAVIGIPLIGVFGVQLGFLDAGALFMLFAYILLPLVNVLFLAMLEVKYSSLP